jgi:hypothetical protein
MTRQVTFMNTVQLGLKTGRGPLVIGLLSVAVTVALHATTLHVAAAIEALSSCLDLTSIGRQWQSGTATDSLFSQRRRG